MTNVRSKLYLQDSRFVTSANVALITGALVDFTSLTLANLPGGNVLVNVIMLAGSQTLFTTHSGKEEVSQIFTQSRFLTLMTTHFEQNMAIQPQDFDQILALKDSHFSMVKLNTNETYFVNNSTKLEHIYNLLQTIISKENVILTKLKNVQTLLQTSEIIKSTKSRRSIFDYIFSEYDVNTIARTANMNYERLNKNFNTISKFSSHLLHQQNQIVTSLSDLTKDEKKIRYQTFHINVQETLRNLYQKYEYSLQQLSAQIQPHKILRIIFGLMTDQQYCELSICYSTPLFRSSNATAIEIQFTTQTQILKRAVYVSCTIKTGSLTSIYSHKTGFMTPDKIIHFNEKELSSITVDQLSHVSIDSILRPLNDSDYIQGSLYPIYHGSLVSLQCYNATEIIIDNKEKINCSPEALFFRELPDLVQIYGKSIKFRDNSLFTVDTSVYANNLQKINEFQPNKYTQSHFDKVSKFFTERHPLKDATFISTSVAGLALLLLTCCCMACCCPAACSTLLTRCCSLGCGVGSLIARRLTPRHNPPPQHQLRRLNPIPDQEQPNMECINGVDHCQCRVTRKRCLRLVDLQRY